MVDYSFIANAGPPVTPFDPLKMATNLQNLENMRTQNALNQQNIQNLQTSNLKMQQDLATHINGMLGGAAYAWSQDEDMNVGKARKQMELEAQNLPQLRPVIGYLGNQITDDMSPDDVRKVFRNFSAMTLHPYTQQQMNQPDISFLPGPGGTYTPFAMPRAGNFYGTPPVPMNPWGANGRFVQPQLVLTVDPVTQLPKYQFVVPAAPGVGGGGGAPLPPAGANNSNGQPVGPQNQPRLGGPGPQTSPAPAVPPPANGPPVSAGEAIGGAGSNAPLPVPPVPPPVPAPPPTPGGAQAAPVTPAPVAPVIPLREPGKPFAQNGLENVVALANSPPPPGSAFGAQGNRLLTPAQYPAGGFPQYAPPAPSGSTGAGAGTYGPAPEWSVKQGLSLQRFQDDAKFVQNYTQNQFPYTEALAKYDNGNTITGEGVDFVRRAEDWVRARAEMLGLPGPWTSTTEKYFALHKWLEQIITTNGVSGQSVAHLNAVLGGSASTDISQWAGIDMIKDGIAMQRAQAAAYLTWNGMSQAQKQQFGTYTDYLTDFNKKVDLRAFAYDIMSDKQKADTQAALRKEGKAAALNFQKYMDIADSTGMSGGTITMPTTK